MAKIAGYGARFFDAKDPGTEFELSEDIFERIDRHAFAKTLLKSSGVWSGFNHDSNFPLGRCSAGTLKITTDAKGLQYLVTLPDSPSGSTVEQAVKRRDVTGASFSFFVLKQTFREEKRGGRVVLIRTIEDLELLEVGPVMQPAYTATTVGAAG